MPFSCYTSTLSNSRCRFDFTPNKTYTNFQITSTAIYQYAVTNNDEQILKLIIDISSGLFTQHKLVNFVGGFEHSDFNVMTAIYSAVIKDHQFAVDDVVLMKSDLDNLALAIVVVDTCNLDILKNLIANGFDPNQYIYCSDAFTPVQSPDDKMDFFSYVVKKNNLELVKLLLDSGADPLFNDGFCLVKACQSTDNHVFNVLFDTYDYKLVTYQRCIYVCLHNTDKLNKLVQKNLNINDFDYNLKKMIATKLAFLSVDTFKLIEDLNFEISSEFIDRVIYCCNSELLDYVLSKGYQLNNSQLSNLIRKPSIEMIGVMTRHNICLTDLEINLDGYNKLNSVVTDLEDLGINLKNYQIF